MKFEIVIRVTGSQTPEVHRFSLSDRGKLIIGRGDDCELQISDPNLSRAHLGLAVLNGKLIACDLKSKFGTLVNGTAIKRNQILAKGHVIAAGDSEFSIVEFSGRGATAQSFGINFRRFAYATGVTCTLLALLLLALPVSGRLGNESTSNPRRNKASFDYSTTLQKRTSVIDFTRFGNQ